MRQYAGAPNIHHSGVDYDEPVEHHALPPLRSVSWVVEGDECLVLKTGGKGCRCGQDYLTTNGDPTSDPRSKGSAIWR